MAGGSADKLSNPSSWFEMAATIGAGFAPENAGLQPKTLKFSVPYAYHALHAESDLGYCNSGGFFQIELRGSLP